MDEQGFVRCRRPIEVVSILWSLGVIRALTAAGPAPSKIAKPLGAIVLL